MTTSDSISVRDRIQALRNRREGVAAIAAAEAAMQREREADQIRQAVRAELGPTWDDLPIEIDRERGGASHIAVVAIPIDDPHCRVVTTAVRSLGKRDSWIVGQKWAVDLWHEGQPYRFRNTYRSFEDALLVAARLTELSPG